jgi:hypothetical protein
MRYMIAAALVISVISFSAAAQDPPSQRSDKSGSLRLAEAKCPQIIVSMPQHKISRDEVDNKLPKNIKWNPDCVALVVGIYNRDLDGIEKLLHAPKCDPTVTQSYIDTQIKGAKRMYDEVVKETCVAKKK